MTDPFFASIVDAGWAGLQAWCNDRQPETLGLEFKGRGDDSPKLNAFDKANIGKAVSGFANISGGVLLIGIDTRKVDGVDCADALRPSDALSAYVEAVNRHLLVCSEPRVPGAHAVGIEDTRGSDRGIVALFVPASDGGPHRAKAAGDAWSDRYFARQGTQTIVLEHPLLAAMFGRVPPPRLELHVSREEQNAYTFRVFNVGRGVARNILFRLISRAMPGLPAAPIDRSFEETDWRRLFRPREPPPGHHLQRGLRGRPLSGR